jgi:hypothetical protein
MISSDLHGAKEPIRWTLGWQSCDEPVHREEEGCLHQDVLAETMAYGDQPLRDGTLTQLIRTPPGQDGRLLGHVAAMLGLFGTCDRLLEPQEGQRFVYWMVIVP